MAEFSFGANILENLTTGMYQDSKVIYREYIQNACDQIDKAEQLGILRPRSKDKKYPDLGEGVVEIWLDPDNRNISIEDNATGIKAEDFRRILMNIADSDKVMGRDKGFRGIGRLCGLAYCKHLIFTSRSPNEDVVSIMTCDAKKMRDMLIEANTKIKKYSASEVLESMTTFSTRNVSESDKDHFFRVDLKGINEENEELFGGKDHDNEKNLSNYLSFVAPVPYAGNFVYRSEIYCYAESLSFGIDEYDIRINGEQIFKKYKTHLKTGKGDDDVFRLEFKNFFDDNGELIAWSWFGVTSFKAAIKEDEVSRGFRLRSQNIQIGDSDTLRNFFTRESSRRGNSYFIGEIFAVAPDLIPNSQRSYFNENPVRMKFEHEVKYYFNNTLYRIYYDGSEINSSLKKIAIYEEKVSEIDRKRLSNEFASQDEFQREKEDLAKKKAEAESAIKKLEKKKNSPDSQIATEILARRLSKLQNTSDNPSTQEDNVNNFKETTTSVPGVMELELEGYLGKKLFPSRSKKEQKLLSHTIDKIFGIIRKYADKKNAEQIIERIKGELR